MPHGLKQKSNPESHPSRRLRRLHRVWPDRNGNISYLLTICTQPRGQLLNNSPTFERLVSFLLDSPSRYQWFGRRFVIMPDHIHVIAHLGPTDVTLGEWIKAMKAVVAGLTHVGPVPSPGALLSPGALHSSSNPSTHPRRFTRIFRTWRWQPGFHDHKFRTPESESLKWEYVCLNPVRAKLVSRPEQWPYAGEIFYDPSTPEPHFIPGTPPLLETGTRLLEIENPHHNTQRLTPPGEGTRPTS